MNLQQILDMLSNANPAVRANTARVLGMVNETEALDALASAFEQEQDTAVRDVMRWAGQRIVEAARAGYTSLDEIFEVFRINEELISAIEPDANEARLLAEMERRLERDLNQMRSKGAVSRAGWTIGAGIAGMATGGLAGLTMAAATGFTGSVQPMTFDEHGQQRARKRIPPVQPGDGNFSVWLKRLEGEQDLKRQQMYLREIVDLNNPSAIPHLFNLALNAHSELLKNAAYEAGKMLYLKMRYWNLTQDGTIDSEFEKRRKTAQDFQQTQAGDRSEVMRESSPDEAARILRQAQKRKRSRS